MDRILALLTEILNELKNIRSELKASNIRLEQIGTSTDEAASLLDDVIDEIKTERYGDETDRN